MLDSLLANVSRSFFLTLRALPKSVRPQISIAYLLARLADTVADAENILTEKRLRLLQATADQLSAESPSNDSTLEFTDLAELIPHRGEQELLRRASEVIQAFFSLPISDQQLIREVLQDILRGQSLDITRFESGRTPGDPARSLTSEKELDEYTYLVAGTVGKFWTNICAEHLSQAFRLNSNAMIDHGIQYGKGLQLLNILRDLPKDIQTGRCYLPIVDFSAENVLTEVRARLPACRQLLENGRIYSAACRPFRLRFATMLPYAIGVRTLDRLEASLDLWANYSSGVKITRPQVQRILWKCFWRSLF